MRTTMLLAATTLLVSGCLMLPTTRTGGGPAPASPAHAQPASGGESASAGNEASAEKTPSGPQIDSVSLHNDCPSTVKLFLGQKPKWGSGTSTTIGSNVTQSFTLKQGDAIWIVDGSDEGIGKYTGQTGMHSVKITASCMQFVTN